MRSNYFLVLMLLMTTFVFSQNKSNKIVVEDVSSEKENIYVSPTEFFGTLSLNFKEIPAEDILVSVKDINNDIVFQKKYENIKSKGFKIDFSELPNGKYIFLVNDMENKVLYNKQIEKKG